VLADLSETRTARPAGGGGQPRFETEGLFGKALPRNDAARGRSRRIQNPGNLGGLLRTAEAAGTTGAYLTGSSADPLSWKALRGSMGSALSSRASAISRPPSTF
jgi:hypothetical protein